MPARSAGGAGTEATGEVTDPREPLPLLRKELGTGPSGLSGREASRRLAVYGPNQVRRRERTSLAREAAQQLAHPLALLLWAAGALAFVGGIPVLGWAILAVIMVNAGFALLQERQAERAVEALEAYLPERAKVIRDGESRAVDVAEVAPGDLVVLEEGDKIPADARLVEGAVEVDLSMLTGESMPVERVAAPAEEGLALLREPNLVFSGTTCVGGRAVGIVFATGGHTELGRIAA
ncbi:HAD-IC family P-type ATPase [Actinomadura vinacea]|uniref:HAD-IC family P-type ATPase n=1 Tax=Actinomadura vinacea TaxID=115336 RepID=UPI0031D3E6B1